MRKKYLDYAKGFAILCMLFTHSMANVADYKIGIWITAFDMPMFFMIGGILISIKYGTRDFGRNELKLICIRKIRQLGIAYIVFCILLMIFYSMLNIIKGEQTQFINYLVKIITLQGIDSLWFIPCFLEAELLLIFLLKNKYKRKIMALCIILAIFFYVTLSSTETIDLWWIRLVEKAAVGFVFVYMGYWIEQNKIIEKISIFLCMGGLIIETIFSQLNGAVGIGGVKFNNRVLFLANAIVGCIVLLVIFYKIEQKGIECRVLSYFGKDSIVILCTNNLIIEVIRLLDYKIADNILLQNGLPGSCVLTCVLIGIESWIIKIMKGPLGIFIGRRQSNR